MNKTNKIISKNLHTYSGKLSYNEQANYIIYSPTTKSTTNISDILYSICYSSNNQIEIKIMKGCKILFNESGRLVNKIDKQNGLLSYHVNSEDLESVIFNNCDDFVDIEISSEFLDNIGRLNRINGISESIERGDNILYGTK